MGKRENRMGKVKSAVLYLFDGTTVPVPVVAGANGMLSLSVPAFAGDVAAIVIKADERFGK